MSPTETHFTASDGMLTWPEIDYYARRAKGGVGLIITQQTQACAQLDPIDPYPRSARLDDDAYIPMMSELTEAVHLQGAKIAVLLTPGGGAQAMGSPYETGRSGISGSHFHEAGLLQHPEPELLLRYLRFPVRRPVRYTGNPDRMCFQSQHAG